MIRAVSSSLKAFTLVEILIVVMIIGIIAGFGIPNYNKAMLKARARDSINNLSLIYTANAYYRSSAGANFSCAVDCDTRPMACTIDNINYMGGTTYVLNILPTGGTDYCCGSIGGNAACDSRGTNFRTIVYLGYSIGKQQGPASVDNPQCVPNPATPSENACP